MYDVVIIGAGVSGCAIARELSRLELKTAVLERALDVCEGTSKANSGIVHAGYDAVPGTLKARLNVAGSRKMEALSKELDFPYRRNGSLVLCFDEKDLHKLTELQERGKANGVEGLRILNRQELTELEPGVGEQAVAALYAPTGGIVCPFGLTIALAENACANGVEFKFNTEVEGMEKIDEVFRIKTSQGTLQARCVVNAAGVYADKIHNMVSKKKMTIIPRRGDYCLLDKTAGGHVKRTIFALPNAFGKGVLVSPTVHGNLIVGPTAMDIEDKEGVNTTRAELDEVTTKCARTVKNVPLRQVITSFAGLRAHQEGHEFIIEELKDVPGFVDCAGIESPGLTSSPAIGCMVADIVKEILHLQKKEDFIATRKRILNPETLSIEERNELIKKQPAYGNIICRCEMVTEGEILDAIHRPLGARSLDGVKRRTRAGMGRCQAGFCSPRTMEILSRELKMDVQEITKSGGKSVIVVGTNKDSL